MIAAVSNPGRPGIGRTTRQRDRELQERGGEHHHRRGPDQAGVGTRRKSVSTKPIGT